MSRRDQIKMSSDEIQDFLAVARTLQVASINADGTPHLVPMWFVASSDVAEFWTYGKSQKVVNLRRDPRISVLVEAGDSYEELRGVSISGRAELFDDRERVMGLGERIYEKYWGPISDDAVRDGVHAMGAKRVGIVVHPEHVVSWDHRKLAGAY